MQLRRLRVKNIRSYESGEVSFPAGTTLLSGDVGAGKTSLLYAIEMALFGVAEVDAAYLVRHGAAHAEVEVEFEDDEHRYLIARRFRRVRRKGRESFEPEKISFSVDGALTTYSATELRQRVIELLGFPDNPNPQAHSDLWRWAVYVPQERMRDILGARPQDRLETVRKALGVERYRIAADNAQELAADFRRSMIGRRAEAERLRHFDREFAEGTQDSDRLTVERRTLDGSVAELARGVEDAESALRGAESAVRQIEADRQELESLEREQTADDRTLAEGRRLEEERRAELAKRRAEAEEAAGEASDLERRRARLASAEARVAESRSTLDRQAERLRSLAGARAELEAVSRRREDAQETLRRADSDRAEAAKECGSAWVEGPAREPPVPTPRSLSEIDGLLREAGGREAASLSSLAKNQSALEELDELLRAGVCPRCHQAVRASEFEAHRVEAMAQTRSFEEAHRTNVREREQLEEERRSRERYERAHERWTEVSRRRDLAEAALSRASSAVTSAREGLESAERSWSGAKEKVESLSSVEGEEAQSRRDLADGEVELKRRAEELERSAQAASRRRAAESAATAIEEEVARLTRDRSLGLDRASARATRLDLLRQALEGSLEKVALRSQAEETLAGRRRSLEESKVLRARVEARWEDAVRRIRAAEEGRAERAGLLAEADDLERKATWVAGPFRTTLLSMEQKLLSHAQAVFERHFARYFASLVDDPALIARTDVAFTPAVTIEGEWTPAEALSGGERTSLALAFRLALAQVVRSLGSLRLETVLLDEPTDGFSPEQVVRMGELLDELALPQVVIVSHEGELASISDRVVRVLKEDGRSRLEPPPGGPAGKPVEPSGLAPVRSVRPRARRKRPTTTP